MWSGHVRQPYSQLAVVLSPRFVMRCCHRAKRCSHHNLACGLASSRPCTRITCLQKHCWRRARQQGFRSELVHGRIVGIIHMASALHDFKLPGTCAGLELPYVLYGNN